MKQHTILFFAANPTSTDPGALGQEARAIRTELERGHHWRCFRFETRWAAQPLDLLDALRSLKPTVVHFSGSGDANGLFFENASGLVQLVSLDALTQTFGATGDSVKVVILNACYREAQAEALIAHVDCVVGMSSIHKGSARSFAIGFYGGIGGGESVEAAYKQGCAAILLAGMHDADPPRLKVRAGIDASKLVLALKTATDQQPDERAGGPATVTTADEDAEPSTVCIVIKATLPGFRGAGLERVLAELMRLSGDVSLQITKIEKGSVRLTVVTTRRGARMLHDLYRRDELAQLAGFDVLLVDIIASQPHHSGADPLRALRERIVELVVWFGEDARRLPQAQEVWRQDELWDRRLLDEEARWQEVLAEGKPLPLSPLEGASPGRLLLELECLDRVAWLFAGSARLAPAELLRRGGREHYLVRLARERTPHAARQAGSISTHLRYHALIPARVECDPVRSYRVRVETMRTGAIRCEEALSRGAVKVATTSFGDDAQIDFTALTVSTAEERARKLTTAIGDAASRGVDILVAPELTVPLSARTEVLHELRWDSGPQLALLVPGSFHMDEPGGVFNLAQLVDGKGNVLSTHRKLTKFGRLEEGWLEQIDLGDEITVIVTPIGTVAVAFSKDFYDDHVGRIWQQLQPEWLLVPAYGKGASAHEMAARRIARMVGTIVILAHEGDRLLEAEQNSFVQVTDLLKANARAPEFFEYTIQLIGDLQSS